MIRAAGTHSYDIYQRYHRCPKCGKIVESRKGYEYRMGKREKDLHCPRCSYEWTEKSPEKSRFGPFFRPEEV